MSAQRLSARSTRRIARSTGLDVVRAWAHGGYTMAFVTADHRHGYWHKTTGEWRFAADDEALAHYVSCRELFPEPTP